MTRVLAIGDIHGCFTALETLAATVPFRDDDLLIALGDYVDRGPDSRQVLDWLMGRHATGQLIPICGNHEIMMLQARDDSAMLRFWLASGGASTLTSYNRHNRFKLSEVPERHWDFLEHETQRFHETDSHFFVHASVRADWPLAEQSDEMLFWGSFASSSPHRSGKIMICGHTAQVSGQPLDVGHAVCIDTAAYLGGWLTCLDPATREYWQANQRGETRRGCLDPRK